jgi:two-component system, OmpR family, phosphate regulon sensor histidine kinase PhoR
MRGRPRPWIEGVIWFSAVMLFLSAMFTAAFYITDWVFAVFGLTPSPLALQLINSVGGLLLTALIIGLMAAFTSGHRLAGEMSLFRPIIDVLERIARGDFSARIGDDSYDRRSQSGFIGQLVTSVNQMALELNEMETLRQAFISDVSHELQSPLTSIRGFAQALHGEHLTAEERYHYLNIIEAESTRLSRITENLLRLASLESEHVRFERIPYRLDRQIRELVLACEPQWTGKTLEVELSLEEATITGSEDLLSQVWLNLIHNSIKFTPPGGKISIVLQHREGKIEFKICDSGIGISAEDQAHIFERFYKADKSRTHSNNSGSGLGLSIVQKIVEMHRGTVEVESASGSGTTFTVLLPVD